MDQRERDVRAWAEDEFGSAALGDERRTARVKAMAVVAMNRPAGQVTAVFEGAAREGAFRLLENDEVDAAELARAAHRACGRRALGENIVRRASAAYDRGIQALEPTKLRVAFVTHLHSDHTVGYPDLIFTPWTIGRRVPLEVYGPKGINAMTTHLLEAYRVDIETRTSPEGNQRGFPDGARVNAHEIGPGVVYKDANVTVTAFATKHAMESYGYRFDTADRSIVISGDTNPTQATIDACHGCDVLIHEAHTPRWLASRPSFFQQFSAKFHTTTTELADLARQAKPQLLILYHYSSVSPEELQSEMRARYPGHFVVGRDLDVY